MVLSSENEILLYAVHCHNLCLSAVFFILPLCPSLQSPVSLPPMHFIAILLPSTRPSDLSPFIPDPATPISPASPHSPHLSFPAHLPTCTSFPQSLIHQPDLLFLCQFVIVAMCLCSLVSVICYLQCVTGLILNLA